MRVPKMKKRSQSPHRDTVSPVPSYYSEPAYLHHRKDVTRDLSSLPDGKRGHLGEDEEGDEETLSLRSMPSSLPPRVRRSQGFPKKKTVNIPELRWPLITKPPHNDYREHLEVRGTGYVRCGRFPPILKSTGSQMSVPTERPPGRAGCRPLKEGHFALGVPEKDDDRGLKKGSKQDVDAATMSKMTSDPPPLKTQRITFHSPVVQAVYPVIPDMAPQTRNPVEEQQPSYPRVLCSAGPEKAFRFKPQLLMDNPPPYTIWADQKSSAQGRTDWTEPSAPTQGRREVLLIRLGITFTKADGSVLRQPRPQYHPLHPLKPSLRRPLIPSSRRVRYWGARGTTLGSLLEEEGCLSPPSPVRCRPGLLEPLPVDREPLGCQVAHASSSTQLQDEVWEAGRPADKRVQVTQVLTPQPPHSPQSSRRQDPGGRMPTITMTTPTPSPKLPHMQSSCEKRHAA